MNPIAFEIERTLKEGARAGRVTTHHGTFLTPAFVPVGTKATVKAVLTDDVAEKAHAEIILGNTYHLYLSPGDELIRDAGGLHQFMNWNGPMVTDSGGFQVFSLGAAYGKGISKFSGKVADATGLTMYDEDIATEHGKLAIIDDEGVTFTSHVDGSLHRFTPERSIEIQHNLGADIFFAFDEPTSPDAPVPYQKEAMYRTHRWAERSLKAHRQNLDAQSKQALFGIVQGGPYPELRSESAREIAGMDFDGFGIGGSYSKRELEIALESALKPLPPEKPRHLLGIGEPADLLEGIGKGIDMFDCTLPTRLGRTGVIYTARGKINILNEKFIRDFTPLDVETGGYASEHFTKAYLAHLFRSKEMLGGTIASLHNLFFMTKLMREARDAILREQYVPFANEFSSRYVQRA